MAKTHLLLAVWLVNVISWVVIKNSSAFNSEKDVDCFLEFFFAFTSIFLLISGVALNIINWRCNKIPESKLYPESYACLLSKITFNWISGLIFKSFRNDIRDEDIWDMDEERSSSNSAADFEYHWNNFVAKYKQKPVQKAGGLIKRLLKTFKNKRSGSMSAVNAYRLENEIEEVTYKEPSHLTPSLAWFLIQYNLDYLFKTGINRLFCVGLTAIGPTLMDAMLKFIADRNSPPIIGYTLSFLLFVRLFLTMTGSQHQANGLYTGSIRCRNALMVLIYKKSLRLSNNASKSTTTGEIINLMQVNTQSLIDFGQNIHMLWSAPLEILLVFLLLWFYVGWSMVAGLAVFVASFIFNSFISGRYSQLERIINKIKDVRIKMMNEILNGVKRDCFKNRGMYQGWEEPFSKLVTRIKTNELKFFKKLYIYWTIFWLNLGLSSSVFTLVTLATFMFVYPNQVLSPSRAFVCLALFKSVSVPIFTIGVAIAQLANVRVSIKRIERFLLLEEIDNTQIEFDSSDKENAIVFDQAFLTWNDDLHQAHLKNLSFRVQKGQLVAVVGKVGSGKSSLVTSLINEMHKVSGRIVINGSVAYTPQQAWIQNETLKENILFGKPFDHELYSSVLKACVLNDDLNLLPAGDLTEIGENGANLSGGQKQRVSLARAVYNQSDIYLLDDPLSAVDPKVGELIFNNVIGPHGILSSKTRLVVTNSISHLPQMDFIVMMNNGSVAEIGSFVELMQQQGEFYRFVGSHTVDNAACDKKMIKMSDGNKQLSEDKKNESMSSLNFDLNHTLRGQTLIEKEHAHGQTESKTALLYKYLKSLSLPIFAIFLVLFTTSNVCLAYSNYWLSQWSDSNIDVVKKPNNMSRNTRLAIYGFLALFQNIFWVLAQFAFMFTVIRSSSRWHKSMLNSILRSRLHFFESTPVGRILNRFSKDLGTIESNLPMSLNMTVFFMLENLVPLSIVVAVKPILILVFVPIFFIFLAIQRVYTASSYKLKRLECVSKSPVFAQFSETLRGISTIKAYKDEGRFLKSLLEKIENNNKFLFPSFACERWISINLGIIGAFISLAVGLLVVIDRHQISPGLAGLILSSILNLSNQLKLLVKTSGELETNLSSLERVDEYCHTPSEAVWKNTQRQPPKDWPYFGTIMFVNYSVRYREELDLALKEINVEIRPREKVGIVGRTGAGKSSLSLALFRILEPTAGAIVIDSINTRNIGLHDLRHNLTIIPQEPVIFSGSIRMNLDPLEIYSDHELWSALDKVHLKEFVMNLDKKLLFECSEGGKNFSMGQRQLLCLARALVRNTKIIILDEATASIDHNTDELVQGTMKSAFNDCTILTIAHRLNTILDSDRIMVLDQGRVVEFDTPQNLLNNKNGLFYSMAKAARIRNS